MLVRALVDDPSAPEQCASARELIARAGCVRISPIVFVETLRVLNRSYGASRPDVRRIAEKLLDHPQYRIAESAILRTALDLFAEARVDFGDAVALAEALATGCVLHTFDRKLAKLNNTALVAGASAIAAIRRR